MTIQELRQKGYKVKIDHKRYVKGHGLMSIFEIRQNKLQNLIEAKGGYSTLDLIKDGKNYAIGAACNQKDSFSRKIALNILVGRLMKQIAP